MRWQGGAFVLALLMAPAGVMGQQGPVPAAARPSPLESVLVRKAELGLSPAQVQKLETMHRATAEREGALRAKVTEVRGAPMGVPLRTQAASPAERQVLRARLVAAQAQRAELRQLHLRQVQEARGILTVEQNARAWTGTRPHQGTGPGRQPHPGMTEGSRPHQGVGPGRQPHPGMTEGSESHQGVGPGQQAHPGMSEGTRLDPGVGPARQAHPGTGPGVRPHTGGGPGSGAGR